MATLEYDLASLKKVGAQQRNDLKQIGNLIMSELKTLREKTIEHEETLTKECKISQKFTNDLPVMVTTIRVVGTGLTDLKQEVTNMRLTSASQLEHMEAAVTNMHQNTYEMTTQMSNLEAEHANLRASVLGCFTESKTYLTIHFIFFDQSLRSIKRLYHLRSTLLPSSSVATRRDFRTR